MTRARLLLGLAAVLAGPLVAAAGAPRTVILATTTSTQDSGLLDVLVPVFETATGYTVKTIAVGTGQALALGDRGEADVVLVHAPRLEREYLARGRLTNRRLVMHNDFLLVGPAADPAGARTARSAAEAFRTIAERRGPFVSRGDDSGTHAREKALWRAAGVTAAPPWYVESGQGMGATLMIAAEKGAYTLADRATYLAFRKRIPLAILVEGTSSLLNVYHVMEVSPAGRSKVNAAGGQAFADFLVSPRAQALIGAFGVEAYGQALFVPDAGKPEPGGEG